MRGHGSVVVGESLPRAVGRSVYLELSARMQLQAMIIAGPKGEITYMDEAEVNASVPVQEYNRAWPMWRTKALAQMKAGRKESPAIPSRRRASSPPADNRARNRRPRGK
jgi:ribulose-5-phosphate 4-epimerase/fuculose-1-phosphate aldolase